MQGDDAFQVVRQVRAPVGLTLRERHFGEVMGMG